MTTVRRATPEDARAIAEVKVETWRATYVGVMPQSVLDAMDVDEHSRYWAQATTAGAAATFVAEQDGAVVGFASVGPCFHEPEIGELYAIYVRPAARGMGAGLALMEAGVGWLSERWPSARPLGRGGQPASAPLLRALRLGGRDDARGGGRARRSRSAKCSIASPASTDARLNP